MSEVIVDIKSTDKLSNGSQEPYTNGSAPVNGKRLISASDLKLDLSGSFDDDDVIKSAESDKQKTLSETVTEIKVSAGSEEVENGDRKSCNGSRQPSGEEELSLEVASACNQGGDNQGGGNQGGDNQGGDNKGGGMKNGAGLVIEGVESAFTPITDEESRTLLAKLEEANRMLEADCKSLRSLSPNPPGSPASVVGRLQEDSSHSRQASISSEISTLSAASSSSQPDDPVVDDLWAAWRTVVDEWNTKSKKKISYVKELTRKGIPNHFRGVAWPLLSGATESRESERYIEYMKVASPCEKLIRRDISRTYPEHELFKSKNGPGQESLFNVMKAYSLHDAEVGYCQGSSFIVGLLLMQMPEEDAFAVAVRIMKEYGLRDLYKPSMAELGLCMFELESMIQELLPELYTHFHTHDFHVSMFSTPWFLTLYSTTLSMPIVCRIFDIFLLEGMEIIFRIGLAMLQLSSSELQSLDMEGMMKVLQKDLPARFENDPESLFSTAFQVKYSSKKMKKLEKEYNTLKSKESEEQAELRRLKTENRLLRQRIESLENETATLADKLIHDQVKHANTSEEIFALRRQMSFSRQQSQEQILCKNINNGDGLNGSAGDFSYTAALEGQVKQLQKSLSEAHQREIHEKSTVQELRNRIKELETFTAAEPDAEVQNLQEQLIASKLREAESSILVKELEQKVGELERHWQKYLEDWNTPDANRKLNKTRLQETSEELMAARIREASLNSEITNLRQKFMEMETSNHIYERQVKRLEGENAKLQEREDELEKREKDLQASVIEIERQMSDLDTKKREEEIMARIKEAEHAQSLAEMQQKIAELEIQNQELVTAEQLYAKSGNDQNVERRIAELREELVRLKCMQGSRFGSTGTYDTDSDDDYELNINKLQLSQSTAPAHRGSHDALQNLLSDEEEISDTNIVGSSDHDKTLVDECHKDEAESDCLNVEKSENSADTYNVEDESRQPVELADQTLESCIVDKLNKTNAAEDIETFEKSQNSSITFSGDVSLNNNEQVEQNEKQSLSSDKTELTNTECVNSSDISNNLSVYISNDDPILTGEKILKKSESTNSSQSSGEHLAVVYDNPAASDFDDNNDDSAFDDVCDSRPTQNVNTQNLTELEHTQNWLNANETNKIS